MNLLATLCTSRTLENPATPLGAPDDWLVEALGGGESSSGIKINREVATTYAAVWRAINLISGDVGKMPLHLWERQQTGKVRAVNHPAYVLIKRKPNPEQTIFEFVRLLQVHASLTGSGYGYVIREPNGDPLELWPLAPELVNPVRENGRLWYVYQPPTGEARALDQANVIHIRGFGYDALNAYSFLDKATETLGYGLAMRKYGSIFFKGSARPPVVLEYGGPGTLSKEKKQIIANDWNGMHQGLEKAHRTAILDGGLKATILPINARHAQLIESRQFEIREIANWFNLPPHKLGDPTRTSFKSLEQENQSYLDQTLDPWLTMWEQELSDKLLTDAEKTRDSHFFEFLRDSVVNIDIQTRTSTLIDQVNNGLLSLDEARAIENRPPLPNGLGASFRIPLNLGVIGEKPEEAPKDVDSNGDRSMITVRKDSVVDSITAVLGRMNARIALAAARAAKHPDRFVQWIDGQLEQDHRHVVEDNLRPAIALLDEWRSPFDVDWYFKAIRMELLTACECQPNELLASVERWRKSLNANMKRWFLLAMEDHSEGVTENAITQ